VAEGESRDGLVGATELAEELLAVIGLAALYETLRINLLIIFLFG